MAKKKPLEEYVSRIEESGKIKFVEITGDDYIGNRTRVRVKCIEDNHEWVTTITSLVRGSGCPKCAGQTQTLDDYIARIEESGKVQFVGIVGEGTFIGNRTRVRVRCMERHEWSAVISDLIRGSGCRKCTVKRNADLLRIPLEDYITRIEANGKIKYLSIAEDGEYKGAITRVNVQCTIDEYEWVTTITSLVSRTGCPKCAQQGFNPSKPAYVYLVKWTAINETAFLKFGITNRDVETRVQQQKSNSVYQPEILATKYFEIGKDAVELENKFKELQATLCFGRPSKKLFPDGYTETLLIESLQEALELFL